MRPLLISTNDINGGAARAAYRLHQGLRLLDTPSRMLVRSKLSTDLTVIAQKSLLTKLGPVVDWRLLQLYRKRDLTQKMFSPQWVPGRVAAKVRELKPDIISLHWICNGYMQIEALSQLKIPIVWTLHDMWPFTGGCHYSQTCDRYKNACGSCPQLNSQQQLDLSYWIWWRKFQVFKKINLTVVSPSQWLANCAKNSSLLKDVDIKVIPHGLDTTVFKPVDQQVARNLLNLPQDKKLVLFGATSGAVTDPRKGLLLLQKALDLLNDDGWSDTIELVIFGALSASNSFSLGFKAHYLGHFHDDLAIALIYSAADVMVVPSLQEAFGQTASESLACGTPVVGFKNTGLTDIVTHQQDGYLAALADISDLARGITWILSDPERHHQLGLQARMTAKHQLSQQLQAKRYLSLFSEILG